MRCLHSTAFTQWEFRDSTVIALWGPLGQARVISHLVKITGAVKCSRACRECQKHRDWQLDGSGSICMAFSWAGDGHPLTPRWVNKMTFSVHTQMYTRALVHSRVQSRSSTTPNCLGLPNLEPLIIVWHLGEGKGFLVAWAREAPWKVSASQFLHLRLLFQNN